MKIGIFDSGLGGLFTARAVTEELPAYDYVYLGDTARLPYGEKSHEEIFSFLKEGIDFLFARDCLLVIVACNSASAEALRRVQEEYLPHAYPGRNVLGMIVPMTEACAGFKHVGLIATEATVHSGAYPREFLKRAPNTELVSVATPRLAPLIEAGETELAALALKEYLPKLSGIDALLLGCTHYAIIKDKVRELLPEGVAVVSQDEVVPKKTREYLARHPEIDSRLSRGGTREFFVTDLSDHFRETARMWFGDDISIQKTEISRGVK